jgi:hypothetical protein
MPNPETDAALGGGAGRGSSPDTSASADRARDAGPTSSPGDAGTVNGSWPCSTERLCDDFETQPLGQKPSGAWTVTMAGSASSGQVVRVDDKHAFSGKQSIFFGTSSGAPYAYISPKSFARWSAQAMFGRMMLYFEDVPGGVPPAHAPIVRGTGDDGVAVHFGALNGPPGMTNVYALTFTPDQCDTNRAGPVALPKNRWFCYEWMWRRDTGEWALWTDGGVKPVLAFKAPGGACWRVPTIDAMDFGWMQNHEATAKLSMWIDAVALSDSARLGCPALQGH